MRKVCRSEKHMGDDIVTLHGKPRWFCIVAKMEGTSPWKVTCSSSYTSSSRVKRASVKSRNKALRKACNILHAYH
jgi:hypothetical protein